MYWKPQIWLLQNTSLKKKKQNREKAKKVILTKLFLHTRRYSVVSILILMLLSYPETIRAKRILTALRTKLITLNFIRFVHFAFPHHSYPFHTIHRNEIERKKNRSLFNIFSRKQSATIW